MASLRNLALALAFAFTTISPLLSQAQSTSRTVALASASASAGSKQCYLPNGLPSNDVPCDPTAEHSMCCNQTSLCVSNGLCVDPLEIGNTSFSTGQMFARGTCTDRNWNSKFCPQQCINNQDLKTNPNAVDWRNGGVMVWECEGHSGYGFPAPYCCESVTTIKECCKPTAMFSLQAGSIGPALAIQTYPATELGQAAAPTTSATTSGMTGGTTSPPATTPPPGSIPTESSSASGGSSLSEGAKIGLGVGIGLGGALLLLLGAFLYLYRRSHPPAKKEDANSNHDPHSNDHDERSGSIVSLTSGTTAVGQGGHHGVWVDGRFYPAAGGNYNNSELEAGRPFDAKAELETRRSMKELDGQVMAREIATWEHTPAELPVDNHNSGWGQWEERGRVGAQEGDVIKGGGEHHHHHAPFMQVGEVSPLTPAPAKPAGATSVMVPVGDEQTLPAQQQQQQQQHGSEKWGGAVPQESRWEGVTRSRVTQGHGTG
ncbi:hypothetical protein QBC43DRAFT_300147 [Cladorrhinum sp. PSN259]|nr:hypothetical protein QBC43DRAFT_300147 [Cladorrhinum sp. PSN259]